MYLYLSCILQLGAYIISILTLKSLKLRKFFVGAPTILIENGKLIYKNMKKSMIDVNDLLSQAREMGYFDLSEIEYGILENNGQMSFLTSNKNSNSSSDNSNGSNNSSNQKPRLPIIYILDGEFNRNSLTSSTKGDEWIINELKKHKINSIKDVLIAMTDTNGRFIYQLHNKEEN